MHEMQGEMCSQNKWDYDVHDMYVYVHEMLLGYARVWENKSPTVAWDLGIFCREEMLENNSAGTRL